MSGGPEETGFYRILVAIETDATRYYGPEARRPGLLGPTDAETLLAHLAADLNSLLPGVSSCSLITAGALYDQVQVLRPRFPIFEALESVPTTRRADRFKPGLVSIGATDGSFPGEALQPLDDIPLGLLQLLPLVVHGPADTVAELGQAMEYRFLEEGQLSAHSAAWLASAFDILVNHARFMTLTDLSAMLRLQLDHFGFLPMWELIDAGLSGRTEPLSVEGNQGQRFEWRDGVVYASFETFDFWATSGRGAQLIASQGGLAEAYAAWTRESRQYLTTLRAHGLEVRFRLSPDETLLEGSFFRESSDLGPGGNDPAITEHSFGEMGTIAITVVDGDRVDHYYPLTPGGLNDVHAHLRDRVPEGRMVAFPGTIRHDEKSRQLVPDSGSG